VSGADETPQPQTLPAPQSEARGLDEPFVFSGEGGEYFRIWVVNAVLSIVTLGIYSAWAKVRKASYFARNTRLLGDPFEFVADARAILRGRVLALALLGFYTYAFEFSLALGIVATLVLLALAPLLFASATRFRLQNTRWRALRFGFAATPMQAYRSVFFVVAMWISGGVAAALRDDERWTLAFGAATALLLPWMHHRLKAFQHRHATFAGHASAFRSALGTFYGTYLLGGLIVTVSAASAGTVAVAALSGTSPAVAGGWLGFAVGAMVGAAGWIVAWPYFAARIQRAVWTHTTLGPFEFETSIAFKTLLPIALKNGALVLLTAGLYWPFASVAWARYRIGCMRIVGSASVDAALARLDAGVSNATVGAGAIDFFGIDVGW
jgi:uncharacterized membrane protein YjgN (DUF898 family)